jgi:protein-S-isoprenylcysteine O-methyltransferase Ste14
MPKMTPEQEAAYALDFGVARSDLPEDARHAYDRLVEQRARAAISASGSRTDAKAASGPVILPRWAAAVGTALVFLIGQGGGVVLLPYAFTHWQAGQPPWPVVVRGIGVALIAAGGIVVIWGFVRFATEGIGVPVPVEPTSRRLTVGGPYRYVRHPLYLAIVVTITGQALLFSRPVLLVYAAIFLAAFLAFVHWYEEPSLVRRFGAEYQAYRQQVPGWWPRLRLRAPAISPAADPDPPEPDCRPPAVAMADGEDDT